MIDREWLPGGLKMGADLHQAADVAGGHCVGPGLEDVRRLALAELTGDFRLLDVIGTGRPAADLAVGHFQQGEIGDPSEQLARRIGHFLRVGQMAGVVIGHLERLRQRRQVGNPQLVQENGHVHGLVRQRLRPVLPLTDRRRAADTRAAPTRSLPRW